MRYFAIVTHHSLVGYWEEIKATSLISAKRQATKEYGNGFIGHVINLVECTTESNHTLILNDLPSHTKVIGENKWHCSD